METPTTTSTRGGSETGLAEKKRLRFRTARLDDGPAIWSLVRRSKFLDNNSAYTYLLLCEQFGETSVVAEAGGEIVGFVTAFRLPRRPEVIFVWQVGVDEDWRGQGIAGRLLRALLQQEGCEGVTHMETTVTPSNEASQALFRSLARRLGANLSVRPFFDQELFPGEGHETEELYRIGPFETPAQN